MAIKPHHSPKADAALHGRLLALDFLSCLGEWTDSSVDVYLDVDTLDTLENPVNGNMHYHEELVARTVEELKRNQEIMAEPYPQRLVNLRDWYQGCVAPLEAEASRRGNSVRDLDIEWLCDEIKSAKDVKFFGGSSLGILKRLHQKGVAKDMQCYLQAVSHNMTVVLTMNLIADTVSGRLRLVHEPIPQPVQHRPKSGSR